MPDVVRFGSRFLLFALVGMTLSCGEDKQDPVASLPAALEMHDITWTPLSPQAGDSITLVLHIRNSGGTASPATGTRVAWDGSVVTEYVPTPGIEKGRSGLVVYRLGPQPAGNHQVETCVDVAGLVTEDDKGDNCLTKTLIVQSSASLPNLTVDRISVFPAQPMTGETAQARIVIKNAGRSVAPASLTRWIIDQQQSTDSLATPPIAAGAEAVLIATLGPLSAGGHTVQACANASGRIEEENDADNCRSADFLVLPPIAEPTPELSAIVLGITPNPAYNEDTLLVRIEIRNVGSAAAPATHAGVQVDGAVTCPEIDTPGIPAGGSVTVACTVLPLAPGWHPVQACADVANLVTESNENDNCASAGISVNLRLRSNLRVEGLSFFPEHPMKGDSVFVSARVLNRGEGIARTTRLRVQLDGMDVCAEVETPEILPAGGATVTCLLGPLTPGEHRIAACADITEREPEDNEQDNCLSAGFMVADPDDVPNLVANRVSFVPENPQPGDRVMADVHVGNVGLRAAAITLTRVRLNGGVTCDGIPTPAIPAGGEVTARCDLGNLNAGGRYSLEVCVDRDGQVVESDEQDNCLVTSLNVPGPDVKVLAVTLLPRNPREGDSVRVTAVIQNVGTATALPTKARVSVSGVTSCVALDVPALEPGAAATVTCETGSWPAGSLYFEVMADATGILSEVDEGNNSSGVSVQVATTPKADLYFGGNVSAQPSLPRVGERVAFNVPVYNGGEVPSPESTTSLKIDGQVICPSVPTSGIPVGGTTIVRCEVDSLSEGSHLVEVCFDAGEHVSESNEGNNCGSMNLSVRPRWDTDLQVEGVSFAPSSPGLGDPILVIVPVKNSGTKLASATVTRLEISPTGKSRSIETPSIPAGESVVLTCRIDSLTAGQFYVIITADWTGVVEESNESNNSSTSYLNVNPQAAPNLVLYGNNVRFSPAAPQATDSVTVDAWINNYGQRTAPVSHTQVLVDGEVKLFAIETSAIESQNGVWLSYTGYMRNLGVFSPGWHWIEVIADAADEIAETNESDNWAFRELLVSGPAGEKAFPKPPLPESIRKRLEARERAASQRRN